VAILHIQLAQNDLGPNRFSKLKLELMRVWCQEMLLEYFQNLSNSMPIKCLQMVMKKKGNMTKY